MPGAPSALGGPFASFALHCALSFALHCDFLFLALAVCCVLHFAGLCFVCVFWFFKADIAAILVDATHDAARTDARRFANTDPSRAIRRRGRTRGSGGHCVDISTIRAK